MRKICNHCRNIHIFFQNIVQLHIFQKKFCACTFPQNRSCTYVHLSYIKKTYIPQQTQRHIRTNMDYPPSASEIKVSIPHKTVTQLLNVDPSSIYIEEEAFLHHNPSLPSPTRHGVKPEDLQPIPPPPTPPFKALPETGKCKWTWDHQQRILLADFSLSFSPSKASLLMDPSDEQFFLQMMERNDITLISQGLISIQSLNKDLWTQEYLGRVLSDDFYHKFRMFNKVSQQDGLERYIECDDWVTMKVGTYIKFLNHRQNYLLETEKNPIFAYVDHKGVTHWLHIGTTVLYMVDVDTSRLLPELNTNFFESFLYHGILPGGSHCLMNSVSNILTARQ